MQNFSKSEFLVLLVLIAKEITRFKILTDTSQAARRWNFINCVLALINILHGQARDIFHFWYKMYCKTWLWPQDSSFVRMYRSLDQDKTKEIEELYVEMQMLTYRPYII